MDTSFLLSSLASLFSLFDAILQIAPSGNVCVLGPEMAKFHHLTLLALSAGLTVHAIQRHTPFHRHSVTIISRPLTQELGGSGRENTSSAGALRWFSGAGRASWCVSLIVSSATINYIQLE